MEHSGSPGNHWNHALSNYASIDAASNQGKNGIILIHLVVKQDVDVELLL